MRSDSCNGLEALHAQHEEPAWEPLVAAVGERLAAGFIWMHEDELEDGSALHAYKHIHTRRYLYLTGDGRAFDCAPCRRYVRVRLEFAIEGALCSWWILSGWDASDADAVRDAVVRAAEHTFAGLGSEGLDDCR